MARYDMTGHFRDLPKQEGPKKPGKTQGAQKRVDALKTIKARVVQMAKSLSGSDSSAVVEHFTYQETWFRKSMTWCRANGFPKTADSITQFLNFAADINEDTEPDEVMGNIAPVIVAINTDLRTANRIFGTKMAKSIVIKAKRL